MISRQSNRFINYSVVATSGLLSTLFVVAIILNLVPPSRLAKRTHGQPQGPSVFDRAEASHQRTLAPTTLPSMENSRQALTSSS